MRLQDREDISVYVPAAEYGADVACVVWLSGAGTVSWSRGSHGICFPQASGRCHSPMFCWEMVWHLEDEANLISRCSKMGCVAICFHA